jgi:hypothetical protein
MHFHTAYDLTVQSAFAIPEFLRSVEGEPDVRVLKGVLDAPRVLDKFGTHFEVEAQRAFLYWNDIGGFLIQNGNEVVIDALPGVEERALRLPLLGTAFAALLHQRGFLVLHASAVEVQGVAAVFLGHKKQGKSTMAAALYKRGHPLISDDTVAVKMEDGQPMVVAAFPQFKLWPETATNVLGENPEDLPLLVAGYEKRSRRIEERFTTGSHPLGGLFSLSEGDPLALEPLDPQEGITQLVCHSYMARFGGQLLKGNEAARHLRQCASLVSQKLVYRLQRPKSFALLPQITELIEAHFEPELELVGV